MKVPRALSILALGLAILSAAPAALAQWVWKDDSGQTVASDQPPPPNIPASRILRTPAKKSSGVVPTDTNSGNDANDTKSVPDKSLAQQNQEFEKRQKAQADAAKKQQEEAAKAQRKEQVCTALRSNLAGLEAGGRIVRINEQGEREYLDDSQRQAEIQRTQSDIAKNCS